jgi:hypothetical protein
MGTIIFPEFNLLDIPEPWFVWILSHWFFFQEDGISLIACYPAQYTLLKNWWYLNIAALEKKMLATPSLDELSKHLPLPIQRTTSCIYSTQVLVPILKKSRQSTLYGITCSCFKTSMSIFMENRGSF